MQSIQTMKHCPSLGKSKFVEVFCCFLTQAGCLRKLQHIQDAQLAVLPSSNGLSLAFAAIKLIDAA